MHKKALLLFILTLTSHYFTQAVQSFSWEVDMTTTVSQVVDGDTFDATSGDRVRLADIDTPELGEPGYFEAKDFLTSLVNQKTVYLDIDDIYRTDPYGRLVCVVYIDYNSTHVENVNKALLDGGYAQIWDFDNEFDPYTWTLYNLMNPIPEFPTFLVLPLLAIATVVAIVLSRRRLT